MQIFKAKAKNEVSQLLSFSRLNKNENVMRQIHLINVSGDVVLEMSKVAKKKVKGFCPIQSISFY